MDKLNLDSPATITPEISKISELPEADKFADGPVVTGVQLVAKELETKWAKVVGEILSAWPISAPAPIAAASLPAKSSPSAIAGLSVPASMQHPKFDLKRLRASSVQTRVMMDPRLQLAAARARQGLVQASTASSDPDEIPVIAKVESLGQWEAISEVRTGETIGRTEDGRHLVTGRIPLKRAEAVRKQPGVVSLKAAQPLMPGLSATLTDTRARVDLLPANTDPEGGKGVVLGVVDFGCDFVHKNFLTEQGATRIEAIWHQGGRPAPGSGVAYGRVFREDSINAALRTANPYRTLGYVLPPDSFQQPGAHGTHVLDIAAGNGRGTGLPGCAPAATIVFVDLAATDLTNAGIGVVGQSLGDSVRLLEALKFIFDQAGDRPCVINVSLGTNGGPHDGTSLVEQGIDALVSEKPDRCVVISAANAFSDGIHASGSIPADGVTELSWNCIRDYEEAEMEIWTPSASRVAVELLAPDQSSLGIIKPGEARQFDENGQILAYVANRLHEPNNGDNCVGLFLSDAFPAGAWTVRLIDRAGAGTPYHAWIERNDRGQSHFSEPHDNRYTLGSISCGKKSVVVASYDAHKTSRPISWFSSSGPTRDGRQKPEISAPGHDVVAARSGTGTGAVRKSGTSMAAPAVSGIVALIYAETRRKGRTLGIDELHQILRDGSTPGQPAGAWDPRFGFGRVSAESLTHV